MFTVVVAALVRVESEDIRNIKPQFLMFSPGQVHKWGHPNGPKHANMKALRLNDQSF